MANLVTMYNLVLQLRMLTTMVVFFKKGLNVAESHDAPYLYIHVADLTLT